MCVSVYVCICVHIWRLPQGVKCPLPHLAYSFEAGFLSLNLGLTFSLLFWKTGSPCDPPVFTLIRGGVAGMCRMSRLVHGC